MSDLEIFYFLGKIYFRAAVSRLGAEIPVKPVLNEKCLKNFKKAQNAGGSCIFIFYILVLDYYIVIYRVVRNYC